jgi:hypothetical protein
MSIQSKEGFKSGDASLYIRVYLFEDSFIPLFRDAPKPIMIISMMKLIDYLVLASYIM